MSVTTNMSVSIRLKDKNERNDETKKEMTRKKRKKRRTRRRKEEEEEEEKRTKKEKTPKKSAGVSRLRASLNSFRAAYLITLMLLTTKSRLKPFDDPSKNRSND